MACAQIYFIFMQQCEHTAMDILKFAAQKHKSRTRAYS